MTKTRFGSITSTPWPLNDDIWKTFSDDGTWRFLRKSSYFIVFTPSGATSTLLRRRLNIGPRTDLQNFSFIMSRAGILPLTVLSWLEKS